MQPGSPHTLAVSRSPSNGGTGAVAVYDDGTQRNGTVSSFDNPSLAFDKTDSSRLYALGSGSLRRLSVTASGVSLGSTSSVSASGPIKFDDGRLYAASGQVFDPATASLLGTFTGTNINSTTPFLPDSKVKRVYFLTAPFSSPGSPATLTLRVFDQQTFVPTGTLDIPGVFGSPSGLVRWGANGLAFCTTGGQLFLIQTTLVPSNETVPQPSPTPTTTPTPVPTPPVVPAFARRLALPAKDIVYDAGTQRIYASVSSSAGAGGNSLTPVNPSDGTTGTPVFVGSEPNKLAISDNGQFIYVGLDGAASVRRFDIASQTAGIQFPLGSGSFSTGPFYVEDMEVLPGNANAVAVSRRNVGFSPKHEGVAVYDDGVQRPTTTPSHTGSNSIEFSASASTLYGFNNETTEFGFRKMAVDASGVTVTQVTGGIVSSFGNNIEFDAGRVYFSTGRVIEPESATILGTFPNIGFGNIVLPDSSVGRTFFVSGTDLSDQSFNSTVTIRAFDQRTFLPVGSATVAGVNGRVLSFIRWGANGLAFCTSGGQLFLVQTALVPSAEAVPSPTPTASPTPVPSPSPAPTPAPGELRQLSLATNDLVVDPNTQTIYASLPSSAGAIGNSIAAIDPAAGVLGQAVFVGSEPNKLAISDNGQFIYVGLDGAASVRRFDVATKTAGLQFGLGSLPFGGGSLTARDISVAPGQPGTIAVVRRSGTSSGGVAVYDDGAPRTATESQSTTVEFSASPLVLYGFNGDSSEFGFRKLAVGPCGLTTVATTSNLMSGFSADFKVDNATAYSSSGRAFDPEAARIAGTFPLVSPNSFLSTTPLVAPDAKAGRVYFLLNDGGFVLRVYDIKTFLKIGELRLPGVTGTASSLVRWGANGLAFRTSGGQLFLLQHALVGGTDPSFTPAPAPAPPTFTAVGKVNVFGGGDAGGVTLSVAGSATATATTDANGNFTIAGLPPCGGFTVTPSKTNYVFSPASVTVASPASSTGLNFSATLKQVGFAQNALSVSEGVGKAVLTVTRNNSTGPASVSYETAPGTASDRSDFNTTFGTLQFATGEASKTISILIDDDALVEGSETFNVTLKDPSGAALSPVATSVTVTILDNDTAQPAANPLSDARFFVRRHYQDFLNRDAADDPSGFDFWSGQITACNALTDAQQKADCLEDHRLNVSAAFFLSIEFQQTGFLVHRFYTASYPDSPARPRGLPRFLEFLRDTQDMQRGVVVGQGAWQTQLEANKQAFALAFVQRPEFLAQHPEGTPAEQLVDDLFRNASATPTDAERAAAIAAFGGGGASGRAAALRSVAESKSVSDRQFNAAFVLMQYFGYLRRNPDDAPDGDFRGYQFWLDKLNGFGDFRRAEMVKAFLVSFEYQQRFGPIAFDIRR